MRGRSIQETYVQVFGDFNVLTQGKMHSIYTGILVVLLYKVFLKKKF